MTTVLIVDDNASFRASARRLLEAEGFDVVGEVRDGHSAITAAQDLQPDIVLLDVQLPDLDGFEVAERLTARGLRCAVVLTSSRNQADYGSLVDEAPVRGFVPKAKLSGALLTALLFP